MADPYIDPQETQIYGPYAREQMEKVCLGLIPAFDAALRYCTEHQAKVDAAMAAVLARQPQPISPGNLDGTLEDARDVLVRFNAYLNSLKGHPVDPAVFFGKEAPSLIARRRAVKLKGAIEHIIDELDPGSKKNEARRGAKGKSKAAEKAKAGEKAEPSLRFKDQDAWLAEFKDVHVRLSMLEMQQRSRKVEIADLQPDVAVAREEWLAVYTANKAVVSGFLRHAGKLKLLPVIFDDLAEVHRADGVSDDTEPPPGTPEAPPRTATADPVRPAP